MSLRHIMLGMLREPSSGYDIRKRFEKSVGNFWRAELSQIYPLLQKMEAEGLLRSRAGESEIGPTRRVYKRTARGLRELRDWISAGPNVGNERITYLAQVNFLYDLDDPAAAIEYMEALRDHMAEWLAQLEQTEEAWRTCDPRYPDDLPDAEFYPQLTLDFGMTKVRANLEWCERSLARMKTRQSAAAASA